MTAIASPTCRTLSCASPGCCGLWNSCSTWLVHLLGNESCVSGSGGSSCTSSAPLSAKATPGAAAAADRSTERICACATGLLTKAACSIRGSSRSAMNCPQPVSSLRSSRRSSERPIWLSAIGLRPSPSRYAGPSLSTARGKRVGVRGGCAHRLCPGLDRLDDVHVAGAAAEHRRDRFANFVLAGVGIDLQVIERGDQHSRRAEAALQCVVLMKSLLHRVELVAIGEALNRPQLRAIGLHREHQARPHRLAVEKDRAGAADPVLAADMRAGQPQFLANEIDEQLARLAPPLAHLAVDGQANVNRLRHAGDP